MIVANENRTAPLTFLLQRVQWKKKLGLRDESIYKDGAAGDGANQTHKRQG